MTSGFPRMVALGYGKFVRADRIFAVVPLDELDATWIRGNGERWTAHPDDAPDNEVIQGAIEACREALGDDTVEQLAALPEGYVTGSTRYCHASPVSDVRSFLPAHGENDPKLLGGVIEERLVFGHTHIQFSRRSNEGVVELVDPGSVGLPGH